MSDPVPSKPPTLQLPAVSPVEIAIAKLASSVDMGFRGVKADMDLLAGQMASHSERLGVLEGWRQRSSDRARKLEDTTSYSDLSQDKKIADVIVKVEETHAIATQTASNVAALAVGADARAKVLDGIAGTIDGALKSAPVAKIATAVLYALGGFLVAVLTYYAHRYGAP